MKSNKKMLRSFVGAALTCFLCIWPASTFNMPALLIPGGILGWLIGYHGDRLTQTFRIMRRVFTDKKLTLKQFLRGLDLKSKTSNAFLVGMVYIALTFFAIIFLVVRIFSFLFITIPKAIGKKMYRLYRYIADRELQKRYQEYISAHPVNQAFFIRSIIGIASALLLPTILLTLYMVYGPSVGDTYYERDVAKMYNLGQIIGYVFVIGALSFCAGTYAMNMYMEQSRNLSGFYSIWERFSRNKTTFILREIGKALWINLSIVLFVGTFLAVAIGGMIVGFIVGLLLFMPLLIFFRILYKVIDAEKDWGITSLLIGIGIGTLTFFIFRNSLVFDLTLRLVISLAAGIASGMLSVGVMVVTKKGYHKISFLKTIGTYKGDWLTDLGLDGVVDTWERCVKGVWILFKKSLPAYVTPSL